MIGTQPTSKDLQMKKGEIIGKLTLKKNFRSAGLTILKEILEKVRSKGKRDGTRELLSTR